jgi:hypothetical protein
MTLSIIVLIATLNVMKLSTVTLCRTIFSIMTLGKMKLSIKARCAISFTQHKDIQQMIHSIMTLITMN